MTKKQLIEIMNKALIAIGDYGAKKAACDPYSKIRVRPEEFAHYALIDTDKQLEEAFHLLQNALRKEGK